MLAKHRFVGPAEDTASEAEASQPPSKHAKHRPAKHPTNQPTKQPTTQPHMRTYPHDARWVVA